MGISTVDPFTAFLLTFAAATLPIYVGILLPRLSGTLEGGRRTLLFGIGIGVLLVSFFDLMKGTAGISTSILRSAADFFNVVALGVGLLAFLLPLEDSGDSQALLYFWVLLGVGFHSFGEGIVVGYDFATGATVLSVFQLSSFTLHKVGEGFTIGLLFVQRGGAWWHGSFSGLLGGFPALLGALAGISGLPAVLSTYFFAVGAGATIYMLTRFAFWSGSSSSKTLAGIFLGFLYMYLSGVLHQFA